MNPLKSLFGIFFKKIEPDYIVYLRHEYRGKEFTVKVYREKIDYFGKAEYKIIFSSIPWDIKCGYEEVPDKISQTYGQFREKVNNEMLVGERENEMIRRVVNLQVQDSTLKL